MPDVEFVCNRCGRAVGAHADSCLHCGLIKPLLEYRIYSPQKPPSFPSFLDRGEWYIVFAFFVGLGLGFGCALIAR